MRTRILGPQNEIKSHLDEVYTPAHLDPTRNLQKDANKVPYPIDLVDKNNPTIVDAPGDGDCQYYALALSILSYTDHNNVPAGIQQFLIAAGFGKTPKEALNNGQESNESIETIIANNNIASIRYRLARALKTYALQKYQENKEIINQKVIDLLNQFREFSNGDQDTLKAILRVHFSSLDTEILLAEGSDEYKIELIINNLLTTTYQDGSPSISALLIEHALDVDIQNWLWNKDHWDHENLYQSAYGLTKVQPTGEKPILQVHRTQLKTNSDSTHYQTVMPETTLGKLLENKLALEAQPSYAPKTATTKIKVKPKQEQQSQHQGSITNTDANPKTKRIDATPKASTNTTTPLEDKATTTVADHPSDLNSRTAPVIEENQKPESEAESEIKAAVISTEEVANVKQKTADNTANILKETSSTDDTPAAPEAHQEAAPTITEAKDGAKAAATISNFFKKHIKPSEHNQLTKEIDLIKSNTEFFKENLEQQKNGSTADEQAAIEFQLEEIRNYERSLRKSP